jgi:hypothetical protein
MLLAGGDISMSSSELEIPSGNLTPFPKFLILLVLTGIYDSHCGRQFVCCQTKIYKEWSPICLKETNKYARSRV